MTEHRRPHILEMWGGLECTVVRVGDEYRDQFMETGHNARASDIEMLAELGIKRLRYPILWDLRRRETEDAFWHHAQRRLQSISDSGMAPIVGLTHHGSGPPHTNLLDPGFAPGLAQHAGDVARRFPWVDMYTPVNEPLTTARFSCLYGHWYPHKLNEQDFLRALFNECDATWFAMQEIRRVNPNAMLVQTEDLGRIFSTTEMQSQADYENERRWLSFDLLSGAVNTHHAWHARFVEAGVCQHALSRLSEEPVRPDIFGMNYYLSSDRFLDHRAHDYRGETVGGNGRERYCDLLAARSVADSDPMRGPKARMRELSERYNGPIAVTEVHNGSTRDEQLRWLKEVWIAATELSDEGVDVRGIAPWSLAGSCDWASLLTRQEGIYEPGAYDVRSSPPRKTALARAIPDLAATGTFDHPCLDGAGWWQRPDRFYRGIGLSRPRRASRRGIWIDDLHGPMGRAFVRACRVRDLEVVTQPNAATWANVITDLSTRSIGTANLEVFTIGVSSHRVFASNNHILYAESDAPNAVETDGVHDANNEHLLDCGGPAFIARAGLWWSDDDVAPELKRLNNPDALADGQLTLTYLPHFADTVLDLLIDEADGIWHLIGKNDGMPAQMLEKNLLRNCVLNED